MQRIVEDTLAPNPLFGGELMPVIPEIGYVRHRNGDMEIGRGRWDTKNDIFRCIILCPACNQDTCNQRMWTMYECTRGIVHICARIATERPGADTVTDTDSHFDILIATPLVQSPR